MLKKGKKLEPYKTQNPIIVQSDSSILIELFNPFAKEAADNIRRFAELDKALEHIHTYKISRLSLWNAASTGLTSSSIIEVLKKFSKFSVPENVVTEIQYTINRFGLVRIEKAPNNMIKVVSDDSYIMHEVSRLKKIAEYVAIKNSNGSFFSDAINRGLIKHELVRAGFPPLDVAGFSDGEPLEIELRDFTKSDAQKFSLRYYQKEAADSFYTGKDCLKSAGVIVLPCGSGKTAVAMAVMNFVKQKTLILVTNITAARQWKCELLDKTSLREEDIGEYSGETKEIKAVTIATYQILTYRKQKKSEFLHFRLFDSVNWGLVVYDEVHLLPAPVFRYTAGIQSKRRLGLTATLVREDGKEEEVFSLIGSKIYDMSWKVLEEQGFIASAVCRERRVELPEDLKRKYAFSPDGDKFRIASENPIKMDVLRELIETHKDELILIIGQYIDQLELVAKEFKLPLITGKTGNDERTTLYSNFKSGKEKIIVVSKVANFSVDLPDASVAIQISGTFGSRQEEAQRLGRILRPKKNGGQAVFYSVVSKDTVEQDFALKRQSFLTMQGYKYEIS